MPFSPKQVAAKLAVSVSLVYGLLKTGRLRAARHGCRGKGTWRVEESDLEEYVRSCKSAPVAAAGTPLKHIR